METLPDQPSLKPLAWIGSSRSDLVAFPEPVRRGIGYALYLAQVGQKAPRAKPLRGFGGAGVIEIIEDYDGNAYRAIYTVKFTKMVFVLHAFQKKSKRGIATPRGEIEIIQRRLRVAAEEYQRLFGSDNK